MASKAISQLTLLDGDQIDVDLDMIPIVDASVADALKNKKVNITELLKIFQQINTTPSGVWRDMTGDGNKYDASVNTFPTTGGSGDEGAIEWGNTFEIGVAGTLGGEAVPEGATIRALRDSPGQTAAYWKIDQG